MSNKKNRNIIKRRGSKEEVSSFDFFKKTPFNLCDRWCEKCNLQSKCRIFQDIFSQRLNHIIKGEDPDDPEVIFRDLSEIFRKAIEMIKNDLKKGKIDSNKIRHEISRAEINIGPEPEKFPLWRTGHHFMIKVRQFLERFFLEWEESIDDFKEVEKEIEGLNWYHTFFDAKLYRALCSKWESKKEKSKFLKKIHFEDANISAKLAYEALKTCEKSLEKISLNCPGFMKWGNNLSILAKNILEKIETEFPNLYKAKIIFHG